MGELRPSDDSRFEGLGDWLVNRGQDAIARGSGKGGRGRRWGFRRVARLVVTMLVLLVVAWLVLSALTGALANYLWFQSVGFGRTWTTQFGYGVALFVVGLVGFGTVLFANIAVAWRLSRDPTDDVVAVQGRARSAAARGEAWLVAAANLPRRRIRLGLVVLALALALLAGVVMARAWQTVALWQHAVPYAPSGPAVTDPVFGLDLGWWLFTLPLLHLVASAVGGVLLASLLLSLAAYAIAAVRGADITRRGPVLHVSLLAGLLLALAAALQWLGRYDLSYAQNGFVTGIGATDAAVRLPLAVLTAASTAVIALGVVVLPLLQNARLARRAALVAGSWYVALLVAGAVLPAAYQRIAVGPSQNVAEATNIGNNIAMTRLGFALNSWTVQPDQPRSGLTAAAVANDQATFDNARLWDPRPLAATLDQLQTVRQYYTFTSVNIDRYAIGGKPTEVLLSAREMALNKSQSNPSWVAQRVLYTHGYGVAMVPANGVDANGLPQLIVENLPVTSSPGAPVVTQPRIYFGQRPSSWVLVDARSAEFDYPSSGGNGSDVDTRYAGSAGIAVGSIPERLFWAWSLGDVNLAISNQVMANTRLLLHRSLTDRLGTLAPFLSLDGDPYMVIAPDGHLVYVQDAYTLSGGMPDATAYGDSSLGATYDYIRNSVKITVDAYDGTIHLYTADPSDPLIRAWEGIFPGMFESLSAMPEGLVAHLRTPESMFNAQTQMYAAYHVTDVSSFYKGDNLWTVPSVTAGGTNVLPPQAYYVEIRLPGQTAPEFVLVQPMVPASRPNMIAWVAARNDGGARGQVIVYVLPSSSTIQGPTQIEARIDQDPVISAQISLWNASGSRVIRGSMLVLPVGSSFVYLEPIYLQSTASAFPQLTKVVVASSQTVGWGSTLQEALQSVVTGVGTAGQAVGVGTNAGGGSGGSGVTPSPAPGASPSAGPGGLPADSAGLIAYIDSHFAQAKADEAKGDFVGYGQQMQLVQSALDALDALTGVPPSAPARSAAASAGPASPAP
jgi:uncharacterized membrane protein (UPF0182 family)